MTWVWISAVAFLLSLFASGILIFFGNKLEDLGIVGNVYYIVLIPLGLGCAAFLAGAMKSYASYKANTNIPYGQLKLGGPVVIFALVVIGGFIMPNLNKESHFDLKINVVSDDRPTYSFEQGGIVVTLGKRKEVRKFHDGTAVIEDVAENFNNKQVKAELVDLPEYSIANDGMIVVKKDEFTSVQLIRKASSKSTMLRGTILDKNNNAVQGAFLDFGDGLATGKTNSHGNFIVPVPLPPGETIRLKIKEGDVLRFNEDVTLSSSIPVDIKIN